MIRTTANLVKEILQDEPQTRNNDKLLYLRACVKHNEEACKMPFSYVLTHMNELELPSYETVTRARRKLQADFPELSANADVEAGRMLREAEFRAYAKEVGV